MLVVIRVQHRRHGDHRFDEAAGIFCPNKCRHGCFTIPVGYMVWIKFHVEIMRFILILNDMFDTDRVDTYLDDGWTDR